MSNCVKACIIIHKARIRCLHERFDISFCTGGAPLDELLEESASPDGSNSDCSTTSEYKAHHAACIGVQTLAKYGTP